jgi:hypothetical protein
MAGMASATPLKGQGQYMNAPASSAWRRKKGGGKKAHDNVRCEEQPVSSFADGMAKRLLLPLEAAGEEA